MGRAQLPERNPGGRRRRRTATTVAVVLALVGGRVGALGGSERRRQRRGEGARRPGALDNRDRGGGARSRATHDGGGGQAHDTVPPGPVLPTSTSERIRPVANLAVARVGPTGAVTLYNNLGAVHMVADVQGWFRAI